MKLSFTILEFVFLSLSVVSIVFNILQYKDQKKIKEEKFTPIYNGLVGLFNDIKLKISNYYLRQNLLFNPKNPFTDTEALRWDFYEFTISSISNLDSLREQVVPILKSIDANEDRIFKGADFGLTDEEKKQRKMFLEKWEEEQKILKKKRQTEFKALESQKDTQN